MTLPTEIKAITVPKHGGVEVIELTTIPFPKHAPNEVLIKVHYAGVNFIDTYRRAGLYPAPSFPVRLGSEASGVVVGLPTDPEALRNEIYINKDLNHGARVVVSCSNAMSEYISVPWWNVHRLLPSIPFNLGAAAYVQGLTALTFVTESHNVKIGETILIHTVAGGLGLIFAQLCKYRGATVIGTTSSEEKAELAKAHGADHVIVYTKENTVDRVSEITNGEGVDVIFDGVGKDTFEADFKMLKRKGTLISVGNASGAVPPFAPLKLTEKNIRLMRPTLMNYIVTPAECDFYTRELYRLIGEDVIKIKIFKEYPFTAEGVQQSQIDITGRSTTGKLLIKVSD